MRNRVFHWFYKGFRRFETTLRKPSLGNAFLIIPGAILEKGAPKSSFLTGFTRVSATRFCILRNRIFHLFHKVSRRSQNALRTPPLGNAFFDNSEGHFRKRGPKAFISDRFYKVLSMVNPPCAFYYKNQCFHYVSTSPPQPSLASAQPSPAQPSPAKVRSKGKKKEYFSGQLRPRAGTHPPHPPPPPPLTEIRPAL